jgi:predicted transcriptional regulator
MNTSRIIKAETNVTSTSTMIDVARRAATALLQVEAAKEGASLTIEIEAPSRVVEAALVTRETEDLVRDENRVKEGTRRMMIVSEDWKKWKASQQVVVINWNLSVSVDGIPKESEN